MAEKFACAICLSFDSEVTLDYFVCTKCGHIFHYSCIKSAIDGHAYRKCPVCRKPVSTSALTRLYGIESPAVKPAKVPPSGFEDVPLEFDGKVLSGPSTDFPSYSVNVFSNEHPRISSEYTFHIAMVGNDAVGKTSICRKFINDRYAEDTLVTIGVDLLEKDIWVNDKNIKLCLWDIGVTNHQRFQIYDAKHLRGKHAVLMVYSVVDAETCESMESWNEITKELGPEDAIRVIVGNKCDLEEFREVPKSRGEELGKRMGIPFFETSAKEGRNIETVFQTIVTKLLAASSDSTLNESKAATLALGRRRSSQATRVSHNRKCTIV